MVLVRMVLVNSTSKNGTMNDTSENGTSEWY